MQMTGRYYRKFQRISLPNQTQPFLRVNKASPMPTFCEIKTRGSPPSALTEEELQALA